jgi:hypothetical protein
MINNSAFLANIKALATPSIYWQCGNTSHFFNWDVTAWQGGIPYCLS